LSVGKSQGGLQTTELYNLDHGWNFGMQGSYMGTGGGGNVGQYETKGSVSSSGYQSTDIRTSDESTERRELYSHTTQLSQMYNLFQAFHVGTNRALFLMEPRPHVRQSEATFIQGPRAVGADVRSEEHTSELQSRENLVCRLLLEKKKIRKLQPHTTHA